MIGIIDYGSGNLHAIADIYTRLGIAALLVRTPRQLSLCEKIILPGVGAFDTTMKSLRESGLRDALEKEAIENQKPVLGICVGMQVMTKGSEEGQEQGLGWFNAFTRRFDPMSIPHKPKLPHLGWNSVEPTTHSQLLESVDTKAGFYFLHSFYVDCENICDVAAFAEYGISFAAAIQNRNIFGCQFHPEKSHRNGLTVFRNFANLI